MLTVLLATSTSVLFGCGDFFGGLASRRDVPVVVTANSHVVGLALLTLGALLFPASAVTASDVGWGIAIGVLGGLGVTSMYAAMRAGRMSVVAPVTAALSASVPAAFDLMRGTAVSPRGIFGLVLAVVAIVVVSVAPREEAGVETHGSAVLFSVLAGLGFGSSFIAMSFTADSSGLWPVVVARVASVLLFGTLALATQRRYLAFGEARSAVALTGACDATANITILLAVRSGPLAVASVLGSLYPVVVILLARVVLGERLLWLQRLGVATALIAVVLAAMS